MCLILTLSCDGLAGKMAQVELEVWSDVENPLVGERGATAVFGPQRALR
jgi:glycerate kinase